jgi:hypothetical protein
MSFTPASPPTIKPTGAGTGFSISFLYSKKSKVVRITVTASAQAEHFGGSIIGKRLDLMIGRDSDRGRIKLVLAEEGVFEVVGGIKGSAFIKADRWNLLPDDKRPPQSLLVAFTDATGTTLMLPDWNKVSPVKPAATLTPARAEAMR